MTSVIGAAALVAGGTAAAVVVTSSGPAKPSFAPSDAALSTNSQLGAIFKLHPKLGQPVGQIINQEKLPKPSYAGDQGRIGVPKGVQLPTVSAPAQHSAVALPAIPTAGDLTPLQLASLALRSGCPADEAPIAAAIASAESGGNPRAEGDVSLMDATWDWSEGLWQIRGLRAERGSGELRDSLANADPVTNAAAMYTISSGCSDWTPWSTYNSGAYLPYLSLMRSAVDAAVGYHVKTGSYPPVVNAGGPAQVPAPAPASSSDTPAARHAHRQHQQHGTSHHKSGHKHHSGVHRSRSPSPRHSSSKPSPQPTPRITKSHGGSLPTKLPTKLPSKLPTKLPSKLPTKLPSKLPTKLPSKLPSLPTKLPSLP